MSRIRNLKGERFGKLTALLHTDGRRGSSVIWICRCDCGNTAFVSSKYLVSGNATSCGCEGTKKFKDLTGRRFGRLTALRPTDKRSGTFMVWECRCDCGNTKLVASSYLLNGTTKSCGCLKKGRESYANVVSEWKRLHPDGRMKDCVADTGLHRTTVSRWWNYSG